MDTKEEHYLACILSNGKTKQVNIKDVIFIIPLSNQGFIINYIEDGKLFNLDCLTARKETLLIKEIKQDTI